MWAHQKDDVPVADGSHTFIAAAVATAASAAIVQLKVPSVIQLLVHTGIAALVEDLDARLTS